MSSLASHTIQAKWPAQHPERLQLCVLATFVARPAVLRGLAIPARG